MKQKKKWNWVVVFIVFAMFFTAISPMECIRAGMAEKQESKAIDESPETATENTSEREEDTEQGGKEETQQPEKKPVLKGLIHKDGKTFYYKNGKKITNKFKTVNGHKYYFGKNGQAYTGKRKVNKNYYFFSKTGKMKQGWITIGKKRYYFSKKNGKMFTGQHSISHYLCYFSEKGVLYRKIDKKKKMVALTYDDGPSVNTPKILDTLEKYDAVATFFVVGNRVPTYSNTVKRAYGMGCEIGNHTYEHKILTRTDAAGIRNQVSRTNAAVKKITGADPIVMRPPGGCVNDTVKRQTGMPMILWSIDTLDWRTRNAASTKTAVLDHVKDGDIVLMHDLYEATANASTTIIPTLVERGYQLVTVSELAECRGGMKQGKLYYSFRK